MSFRLTLVADERRILLTPTALCVQHCYHPGQTRPTDATDRWAEIDEWTERQTNRWIDRQTQAILSCTLRRQIYAPYSSDVTVTLLSMVVHNSTTSPVVVHLSTADEVRILCQNVYQLPFSLVPPLPTQHHSDSHALLVPRFANLGMDNIVRVLYYP